MKVTLSDIVATLEPVKGGEVFWMEQDGIHIGPWEMFKGSVFFRLIGRDTPLSQSECKLKYFEMSQLDSLPELQKAGAKALLYWIGYYPY